MLSQEEITAEEMAKRMSKSGNLTETARFLLLSENLTEIEQLVLLAEAHTVASKKRGGDESETHRSAKYRLNAAILSSAAALLQRKDEQNQ